MINPGQENSGYSIVVPTHNRVSLVRDLLCSLAQARSEFAGESEIIIIDSSDPDESQSIQSLCQQWHASYLQAENQVCRKRNIGIQHARYSIVFFIDSDCEAESNVLSEHWAMHTTSAPEVAGILGLTRWRGTETTVWHILTFAPSFTAAFSFAAWFAEVPWGTCTNLSIRRDALLNIGGFDETLPLRVYGEDVDLGLRLGGAGYRIRCTSQAVVWHRRETLTSYRATIQKAFANGRVDYHLGRRFPDRLLLEFPGPLFLLLLLCIGSIYQILQGMVFWLPIAAMALTMLLVISPGVLAGVWAGDRWTTFPYRMGAMLLTLTFEAGVLYEALSHGAWHRLWTKFVYIHEQVFSERAQRILQSWIALGVVLGWMILLNSFR
jgi:glycosyltransferase involved in cell wall biosynthesis